MFNFLKGKNNRGNAFLGFLFFLVILAGIATYIYSQKDFQQEHRMEIYKAKLQINEYKKSALIQIRDFNEKVADWKRSHPEKTAAPSGDGSKTESRTFEQLLYDQQTLDSELPAEMTRHQPDEITICSFSADFLLNNPLNDKELVHLANIFRFCDLSSISGLKDQKFLAKISSLLKILRFNASYEVSAPSGTGKTVSAFLYRNDRIQALKPGKIFPATAAFPLSAYYGSFKVGEFDFIVSNFNTPAAGLTIASVEPLESFYNTVLNENLDIKDIMIFGDFTFRSDAMSWDSASLLPTFARAAGSDKTQNDLIGNFWFKKNDLVEFNGKSGLLNIREDLFTSKPKVPVPANKPIWTQFKVMPDDD